MTPLKHLNSLDYIVIILFLLLVASVGIYIARFNRGTKDYFKAGGKLPWIISSISLFVSGFSAFMFVSASGFTYRNGISSVIVFTSSFGAYWLGYFFYGKLWRRSRIDSPMELLTRRYSQSTTYFYSVIAVIPNILIMGTLIYTLCIFISSALGFGTTSIDLGVMRLTGFELTLVGIGVVLLLYTVLGGLWAVAVTDTLQFIILFIMTLVVFPVSLMHLGDGNVITGMQQLVVRAPEGYLNFSAGKISVLFVIAFWMMNALGYNVNWHIGQRYYSIADERDTKKMAALCAVLGLVAPIMWIMPVMVSRIIFPDLASMWPELTEPTEASFVSLCLFILPHGFMGVVVSAILAASMSSADSTFNWLAAVITKDIYVPAFKKFRNGSEPSDGVQLVVGKMTVLIVGMMAIGISLMLQKVAGSFDIYLNIYSITVPSMFIPVMLGLVYRKTPWWSAMAAVSAGIVCTLLMNLVASLIGGVEINGIGDFFAEVNLTVLGLEYGKFELNVFTGLAVSTLVFFLSSKFPNKREEDTKRLAALDHDLHEPAYGRDEPVDQRSIQSYKIVALLSALVGCLLVVFSFFVGDFSDGLINGLTGLGALLFALFFWYLSRRG